MIATIMHALQTLRLTLRPLSPDDAPFILQLLNEPSYLRYIGDKNVRTLSDAAHYIATGPVATYAKHNFGLLQVQLNDATKTPIGISGVLQRDTLPAPDLGFAFLPAYWHKGYAHEAATAVLHDARTRLHLPRLLAITNTDNHASIQLLQKLGFLFDRVIHLTPTAPATNLFSLTL